MVEPTKLAFLDLETTGLEPFWYDRKTNRWLIPYHEIIDIVVVLLDSTDEEQCIKEFERRVRQAHQNRCTRRARRLNGFSARDWKNAQPLSEALADLIAFLDGAMLLRNNLAFDLMFLAVAFAQHGYHLRC